MFQNFRSRIVVVLGGKEPLPRCDMCGMHMPSGRPVRHLQTERCDRNTQMRWRIWDVEMAANCAGATLSLTGDDGAECFEGVDYFKYLGRVLHRLDEDWPEVR